MRAVQGRPRRRGAHRRSLRYGIDLRMGAPAHLVTLARRDGKLFPEASDIRTMGHPLRRTIVSRTDDLAVPDDNRTNLPPQAGTSCGNYVRDGHEIAVPVGSLP